ncbi:MAG: hypothetical protein JSS02_12265 [Planctomycetes bacterium]|nr:hypothetical protein [Planctomycetota bacterium]
MNDTVSGNFGLLVAYLIPGSIALWGLSLFSPQLHDWFVASPPNAPTIGGFLYLTLAALTAGMTVSALRWALVDALHAWSGITPPRLDFSKLGANVDAFNLLIEIHYRYFQFHANAFVATLIAYACYRIHGGWAAPWTAFDLGIVAIEAVFFITSRDNLRKYYLRAAQLLGTL